MQQYFQFISLANALVAFAVIYLAIRPTLLSFGTRKHLMILVGIHLFRYLGLTLYLPNHFDFASNGVPESLAIQLAYWDFLNGILALFAFVALIYQSNYAYYLTWLFVLVAMGDQVISGSQVMQFITDSTKIGAMPWLLVTIYLPALIVSSIAIMYVLVSEKMKDSQKIKSLS
jgi:hypothetical protein